MVQAQVATLSEVKAWTLDEVAKMNAILDAREDYQAASDEYLRKQQDQANKQRTRQ